MYFQVREINTTFELILNGSLRLDEISTYIVCTI